MGTQLSFSMSAPLIMPRIIFYIWFFVNLLTLVYSKENTVFVYATVYQFMVLLSLANRFHATYDVFNSVSLGKFLLLNVMV